MNVEPENDAQHVSLAGQFSGPPHVKTMYVAEGTQPGKAGKQPVGNGRAQFAHVQHTFAVRSHGDVPQVMIAASPAPASPRGIDVSATTRESPPAGPAGETASPSSSPEEASGDGSAPDASDVI